MTFIPVLSTQAGSCLTGLNWVESATKVICVELASLLFKPGIGSLSKLPQLADYIGWKQNIVLDASLQGKNGLYKLRSPYDGSSLTYDLETILSLVRSLKPNTVILPVGVESSLPASIASYHPVSDDTTPDNTQNVYLQYKKEQPWAEFLKVIVQYQKCSIYAAGEFGIEEIKILTHEGVDYIQSNLPAADAMQGLVYTTDGLINLLDSQYVEDFSLIEKNCNCVTCEQKLTRAYLHHLLQHTPLLCQRFLIQHNIKSAQSASLKGP